MSDVFKRVAAKLKKECEGKATLKQPLNKFSTFKIGGDAALYLNAQSIDDLRIALALCKEEGIPYYIIGKGSNLLVSDEGFKGLVIELGNEFKSVKVESNKITCGAGTSLSKVVIAAQRYSLEGLSFAAGIPGTVGGAVAVNAGAYGYSICEKLCKVAVFSNGGIKSYKRGDIRQSSYRKSFVPDLEIIIEATFFLKKGKHDKIESDIKHYLADRKKKQPQKFPNIGSIFKNPPDLNAGKLIEDAGWKSKKIGGAMVSKKHANFIVNVGKARAYEVHSLMKLIQSDVYYKMGVKLEPEIKLLGFFEND